VRVFLIYPAVTHGPCDVARGYEAALRRADHDVFPLYYHQNINFYHDACKRWEEATPSYTTSLLDIFCLASDSVVARAAQLLPLDLAIIVMGWCLLPSAYNGLLSLNIPLALILTESPYTDYVQKDIALLADITFANDKASVEYLSQYCPTYYLPHSYDLKRHYPQKVSEEYRHDVFFLGTLFEGGTRKRLFDAVNWEGIDASITLVPFEAGPDGGEPEGLMANDELLKHYCGSKIVLSPHRPGGTVQPYSLGPRVYEAAACGAFQLVSNNREGLKEVFGDILPTFGNAEELEEQIRYFLIHDDERKERARAARECVADCSFEDRLRDIILPRAKEIIDTLKADRRDRILAELELIEGKKGDKIIREDTYG